MRRVFLALALAATVPLAACGSVREAVVGPKLSPTVDPAIVRPQNVDAEAIGAAASRVPAPQPASPNSLWRTGARAFFNDQRASRVGDILTVQIDIDDSAKTTNATASSRTSGLKAGVPHLLGLESTLGKIQPSGFDPANALETSSTNSNAGNGSVNRAEKISLTIAAVVTGILPNGNM